ncbi:hypothetical protein DQP57_00550 [Mycobacterium colombiense]|uniref:Uncharacterized protein n=1 Tax=Mycobacterium colombiense TaxID=339268 RepID=A0A329MCW3_9MYCO|nr:hypothetical protein [Mycobacterium colombiense]RAV17548.1 hypothetical protein DQP57_00550 [Mycobacterium colombiense]
MFKSDKAKSVETITAKLADTVNELERHADEQLEKAAAQKAAAYAAEAAHAAHKAEHHLANAVASNIRALLEP